MLVWAGGVVAWFVLLVVTFRCCSGWRSQMWMYGLAPLGILLWYAPEMALGGADAKAVRQVIVAYGFWVAAVYLGGLLTAELVSGGAREKADS